MVTFAVVGHNEAGILSNAVRQALEAASPGDRVWFVDSASTDGSAAVAAALGVEVVRAPLGKGRAIVAAMGLCETKYICLLDADIEQSESNIPLTLRRALDVEPADMIVADFDWPARRSWGAMRGVYFPLVGALFPEAADRFGRIPFSGFRLLRTDLPLDAVPPGFAVETYLNLFCTLEGLRTRVIDVGVYDGPERPKLDLGREVGDLILDMAVADGRLDAGLRPLWDAWLEGVMEVLRDRPLDGASAAGHLERVLAAAARPMPRASRA
jgi:glucosyl-3-phosphoglycerate synthase